MGVGAINNGAELDLKDIQGKTALHYAANWGSLEGTQLLLTHKAEINAKDLYRKTPLDYLAREEDIGFYDSDAAKLIILQQAGAKTGLHLLEEKVDRLSTGTTNPTDEWPRKMWEIDLGYAVRVVNNVQAGKDKSVLINTTNDKRINSYHWITSKGERYPLERDYLDLIYIDNENMLYGRDDQVFNLFKNQKNVVQTKSSKITNLHSRLDRVFSNNLMINVSWEGSKITGWDFTPPSSTAPNPDGGNGGGGGRLIIKTAGPDISLATDGKLGGAAELQKSNDMRSWRRLGDVPEEASEVLVTPRERGNEFYRLKKK